MSRQLNPYTLASTYTLTEIAAKITVYSDALENSVIKSYDKDSGGQGRQKVESADMDKIESMLAVWIQAQAIKNGTAGPRIVSGNFRGTDRYGL